MSDDLSARVEAAVSATHALIDLDALSDNVAMMHRLLPPGAELMAIVKANAYGHGAVPVARAAVAAGASQLAVARIEEGLLLREAGLIAPILVLGPPNPALLRAAIAHRLTLTTGTLASTRAIAVAADTISARARVHLKLETGLHRYGVEPAAAPGLAWLIADSPSLEFEGLYTHYATADESDGSFVDLQTARLRETWNVLRAAGLEPRYVHVANSAGLIRQVIPELGGQAIPLVRPGISLYGLAPSADAPLPDGFRPVLTLKSRLARVFTLPAGETVSYGRTYVAERPVRCATLPVGYGDGLWRHLSNQGWAVVRGVRCPIRGRVCMDQTVIEIEGAGDAREGEEAVLYGDGRDGAMIVDDVARLCDTISYEVVTSLSPRVPRVYLRHGRPVAVSDLLGLCEVEHSYANSVTVGSETG